MNPFLKGQNILLSSSYSHILLLWEYIMLFSKINKTAEKKITFYSSNIFGKNSDFVVIHQLSFINVMKQQLDLI